jgi:hypothetical protein
MERESTEALLESLATTPEKLRSLLVTADPSSIRVKSDDEFSIVENICHLRDIEIEGYSQRIRRILQEDRPQLPDVDGTRLAIERDYNNQPIAEALTAFSDARKANLALLENIEAEQLNRTGLLEGVGEITLRTLLEKMWEHDQGHLEDLARQVRLARNATV